MKGWELGSIYNIAKWSDNNENGFNQFLVKLLTGELVVLENAKQILIDTLTIKKEHLFKSKEIAFQIATFIANPTSFKVTPNELKNIIFFLNELKQYIPVIN